MQLFNETFIKKPFIKAIYIHGQLFPRPNSKTHKILPYVQTHSVLAGFPKLPPLKILHPPLSQPRPTLPLRLPTQGGPKEPRRRKMCHENPRGGGKIKKVKLTYLFDSRENRRNRLNCQINLLVYF